MEQPDQIWLLMLAKKRNDLCLRASQIYKQLMEEFYPRVRFGYINVLEDEALKVAFNEIEIPWTFGIFGGRAYKYYSLEQDDELAEYLRDLERWKKMQVQFDVPARPANKAEIIWFDIKKEAKKALEPVLVGYMRWYHKMRTG